MSLLKSKTPLILYDKNHKFIKRFLNQVDLSKYLDINKSTISRYLKSGKLLSNNYYVRKAKDNLK
jgi:hypothetical protein